MTEAVRRVVLADIDVRGFWRMQQHQDEMLREFALIDIDRSYGGASQVPKRVLELVTQLRSRFAAQRDAMIVALEAAAANGHERASVELELPAAAADAVEEACRMYEEADAFCRNGDLLTLATPPELAELRRALCDELIGQLRA